MDFSTPVAIVVDAGKCKKDGLCAQVCPCRIFRWSKGENPTIERADECVLCGQCIAVCPGEAITHSRLDPGRFVEIADKKPVSADAMTAFLRQRRSVRVYRDRPVEKELLEEIAAAAGFAPTGAFGGEGWVRRVTVVSGKDRMRRVAESTVDYMRKLARVLDGVMVRTVARFSAAAGAGLLTLPDIRMRLAEWDQGRDVVTYDAPAAIFVSASPKTVTPREDCDAALMNIIFAAHSHGLGTCWNGWMGHAAAGEHVRGGGELGRILGLPDGHSIVEALTLGWPGVKLLRVPQRETEVRWVE
ncbi:MAG: hypothetical protein GXP54_09490 [Deltaproteobacteria bacterium]|nr:hypothetical protein [Deltaproteobacteria bacterium]